MPLVLMTIFSLYRKQEQKICSKMLFCLIFFFNHSASLIQEGELQIDVMYRNLKYTIQDHHFETALFVFCFLL